MSSAVDILEQAGVANATAIVAASNATGLPLGVAVGMIVKETNGRNVYGHDAGGACCGWGEVTEDNFRSSFLPVVLAGGTSNGVGPTQITYPGYFRQNPDYPWWDPYRNCLFGFDLLKGHCAGDYSYTGLARAGSIYNSGTATGSYSTYGTSFADLATEWTGILAGADTGVDYSEGEDMPTAQEIADAVWSKTVTLEGSAPNAGKETPVGVIMAWLDAQFQAVHDRNAEEVWGCSVDRDGLPEDDPRQGQPVTMRAIMAWHDACVTDIKHAVLEAVRGITADDGIVEKVKEAVDEYIRYERTEPGTAPAADLDASIRVVQRGDTLKAIAEAAGTTVAAVVALNPGLEPNNITVGQKVRIA